MVDEDLTVKARSTKHDKTIIIHDSFNEDALTKQERERSSGESQPTLQGQAGQAISAAAIAHPGLNQNKL